MRGRAGRRPRVFYGWWIVLGGVVGNAVGTGFNFHALPAFLIPLSESFGVSLTAVAAGISVARIETAFVGPLEGYLVDRFGPRRMMFIGVPVMGTGFLLVSFASSFSAFLLPFLFGVVLGSSLGFGTPLSTALANWWQRRRGRAFGIMWLGHSLGAIAVPLVNLGIESLGWRWTFRIMGMLVFSLGFPVASLLRHRPEQYGMLPDGDDPREVAIRAAETEARAPQSQTAREEPSDFTVWQAIRTSAFWFFAISVSMRTAITTAVAINSFPLVESLGGVPAQASLIILLQGVFSAPGRLFLSWAGDTVNKRYIMAGCLLVMAITLFFMAQATSVRQIALLWVPYAVVWGGLSSLPNPLRADLFGRRNFATIQGAMSPVQTVSSLTAPIFAAWVFQRTDSYRIPFMVFGAMALLGMVLILMAKPPRQRVAARQDLAWSQPPPSIES